MADVFDRLFERRDPPKMFMIQQVANGWAVMNTNSAEMHISKDAEGIVEILAGLLGAKVDVVREGAK